MTARHIFLVISCAALVLGTTSCAAASGQGSSERPANTISDRKQDSRAAAHRSGGVAKQPSIYHETANSGLPARPRQMAAPAVSSLSNVRHRGPNPAVIGGTMNSKTGNTGAIDGTRMSRRP